MLPFPYRGRKESATTKGPTKGRAVFAMGLAVVLLSSLTRWGIALPLLSPSITADSASAESHSWQPPTDAPVLRPFSPGPYRWSPGNRGVDFALAQGASIHAAGPGVVVVAQVIVSRSVIVIDHGPHPLVPPGQHLYTEYEPVAPMVSVGDEVKGGQIIGTVHGIRSACHGSCVHWGAYWGHGHGIHYLSPWMLIPGLPLRLLPDSLPASPGQ